MFGLLWFIVDINIRFGMVAHCKKQKQKFPYVTISKFKVEYIGRSYFLSTKEKLLITISFYLIYVLHPLRKLYWRNHFHYFSNIFATYILQQCFETVLKFSILTLQPFSSKMLEQHWFMSRYYKVITISDSPSRFSSDLQIITTTKDP